MNKMTIPPKVTEIGTGEFLCAQLKYVTSKSVDLIFLANYLKHKNRHLRLPMKVIMNRFNNTSTLTSPCQA